MVTLSLIFALGGAAFAADPLPEPVGRFLMVPTQLEVHEKVTFDVVYVVGPGGLSAGDAVRIDDPVFHGMRWSKGGYLQTDPTACTGFAQPNATASAGLVTATPSVDTAQITLVRDVETPNLFVPGATTAFVTGGSLVPGDSITFTFGDTTDNADCGFQTLPRAMRELPLRVHEKLDGATFTEVQGPNFSFITTRAPRTVLVSAPSQALVGVPFTVTVAALDDLGNNTPVFTDTVTVAGQTTTFTRTNQGVWTVEVTLTEPGVQRIEASSTKGTTWVSNPIEVFSEAPTLSVFWGDLHTHHGHHYTDETGQLIDLNHEYARDVVGLQVGCESQKPEPDVLEGEALWAHMQAVCEEWTEEGRYVAMLGFEWMGNVNSPGQEGHHNVYYDRCDGPQVDASTTGLTGGDISLWAFIAETEATIGARSFSVPHASVYTGFNWRDRDDHYRPIAEIFSEWGDSTAQNSPGSGVYDGLAAGNRMGFMAASDNHDGWLGNRFAYKNAYGGLAAFVATDLSREGIYDALTSRSTYATTGIRPILRFSAEDGGAVPMGVEYVGDTPVFSWTYAAEVSAATVELLALSVEGGGVVTTLATWSPGSAEAEGSFTWSDWDKDTTTAVWLHVIETDGEEAWSSPIWVTADCGGTNVYDVAGRCDTPTDSGGQDSVPTGDSSAGDADSGGDGGGEDDKGRCGGCATGEAGGAALLSTLGLTLLARRRRR
ncbi:DUF3604 domain-containing protein [Myxococcota bacterium]|nr:DUF3604 domain-containing protein [Myxococcota bacterium]